MSVTARFLVLLRVTWSERDKRSYARFAERTMSSHRLHFRRSPDRYYMKFLITLILICSHEIRFIFRLRNGLHSTRLLIKQINHRAHMFNRLQRGIVSLLPN